MEAISYKLPVFEGPLDLLLHLIAKNKLEICQVQITALLEQYLEHIAAMQAQDPEIASEFLEMASKLVYLKSVSLLPKHEQAEEMEKELIGQLLEYRICKEMAAIFAGLLQNDAFVRTPETLPEDPVYRRQHDPQTLLQAYQRALGNGRKFAPPPMEKISAIVSRKTVSVTSQMIAVLRRLRREGTLPYHRLFSEKQEKTEMVATFLAVLELVKNKRLRITETAAGSIVELQRGGMAS